MLIGDKTPTGGDLFAKRNDEKHVFLIPGYTDPIFNRATFDLRDKTLLAFERDKVDRIDVTAGSTRARQTGHRLEDHQADRGHRRLTRRSKGCSAACRRSQMKSIVAEKATPAT